MKRRFRQTPLTLYLVALALFFVSRLCHHSIVLEWLFALPGFVIFLLAGKKYIKSRKPGS